MSEHRNSSRPTRRSFLRGVGMIGLAATLGPAITGALSGCSTTTGRVNMGIILGNQVLWRFLAQKRDELLKPLGYDVTFVNYLDEGQLLNDFLAGKIDVCATLVNVLPMLAARADVKLFLPIAWMKWGFPVVVSGSSSVRSVADLQGKRLATFGLDHPSTIYWQAFVRENYGFDLKEKATLVEYSQLQVQSPVDVLTNGSADAAIVESHALSALIPRGSFQQIGDLRSEWRKITNSDRLLTYGGYVAKSSWVEANKKFVEDMIRLNAEALEAYKGNPASVIEPAMAYAGVDAPSMSREASEYVADYLGYNDVEPERAYLSGADVEDYRRVLSLLARSGYLKSVPQDAGKLFYVSNKRPK